MLTKKKRFLVPLVILLGIGVLLFSQRNILYQEGNPAAIGFAALQLGFTEKEFVQFSEKQYKYLMPSNKKDQPFLDMMAEKGWKLEDRVGGGLLFKKDEETLLATERNWTERFVVIITEQPVM